MYIILQACRVIYSLEIKKGEVDRNFGHFGAEEERYRYENYFY